MKASDASSPLIVTDTEMARLLIDPDHLRYIAPFLALERTVNEVALETNSTLSTTYRRVRRYCDAGILRVVRIERRKGKPLKVYRTVSDAFFVPHRVTDGQEVNSERWQRHWERDFGRGVRHAFGRELDGWGQRLYRNDGVFTSSLARGPHEDVDPLGSDMPALYSRFHDSLYLDFGEAKALQRELDTLFQKYMNLQGQQRYMIRISFVPVPEDAEKIP